MAHLVFLSLPRLGSELWGGAVSLGSCCASSTGALRLSVRGLARWTNSCCTASSGSCHVRRASSVSADADSSADGTSSGNARPFSDIPGPRGLPYIGTLLEYRTGKLDPRKFQDVLIQRFQEFGPIMKETIAGHTLVHLFDPDDIKMVYKVEGKMPQISPLMETAQLYRKKRNLSLGLGNMNGEEWYRLRSAVRLMMLRPKSVSSYLPLVERVADDFMEHLVSIRTTDGQVMDMMQELGCWSLESSANTVFEKRLGYLSKEGRMEADQMIEANTSLFSLSTKLKFSLPVHKLFPTPTWSRLTSQEDFFYGQIHALVDETVRKIKDLEEKGELKEGNYDFVSYLLSRPELDFQDVNIICLSLFADGLFTTRPALVFNLYQLAIHPEVQEHARKEAEDVLKGDNPITVETLNQMNYIKAVVKETFRFMPIGLDISRVAPTDMTLQGYHIPKGTKMELHHYVHFKSPKYFDDPEEFRPERWMRESRGEQIDAHILQPFGHGPRMCAGRRFAEQELYVMLAKMLRRFHIEWHHPPMQQLFQILMVPDCPADFTLLDRK